MYSEDDEDEEDAREDADDAIEPFLPLYRQLIASSPSNGSQVASEFNSSQGPPEPARWWPAASGPQALLWVPALETDSMEPMLDPDWFRWDPATEQETEPEREALERQLASETVLDLFLLVSLGAVALFRPVAARSREWAAEAP